MTKALVHDFDLTTNALPRVACDLGEGFTFLPYSTGRLNRRFRNLGIPGRNLSPTMSFIFGSVLGMVAAAQWTVSLVCLQGEIADTTSCLLQCQGK